MSSCPGNWATLMSKRNTFLHASPMQRIWVRSVYGESGETLLDLFLPPFSASGARVPGSLHPGGHKVQKGSKCACRNGAGNCLPGQGHSRGWPVGHKGQKPRSAGPESRMAPRHGRPHGTGGWSCTCGSCQAAHTDAGEDSSQSKRAGRCEQAAWAR